MGWMNWGKMGMAMGLGLNAVVSHAVISPDVPRGEIPNNVCLLQLKSEKGEGLCSASLVHPKLLLTADHCVEGVKSIEVVCGTRLARRKASVVRVLRASTHQDAVILEMDQEMLNKPMPVASDEEIRMLMMDGIGNKTCATFGAFIHDRQFSDLSWGTYIHSASLMPREYLKASVNPMVALETMKARTKLNRSEASYFEFLKFSLLQAKTSTGQMFSVGKGVSSESFEILSKKGEVFEGFKHNPTLGEWQTTAPGDSGGPVACKAKNGEWIQIGVNSMVMASADPQKRKVEASMNVSELLTHEVSGMIARETSKFPGYDSWIYQNRADRRI